MFGWSIALLLLILSIGLIISCRRLKAQLRQEQMQLARLKSDLAGLENELADVKTRRKRSFAASTEALIMVERDYTISFANKVARKMFGKPARGITLMTWTRQHRLQELVDLALTGQKTAPVRFNLAERALETHARSVKVQKDYVAVALAIRDVTELQHLSRARRDFVANISHELRTPLASIQLLTETLMNGVIDDKPMALSLIEKISLQTDALRQLAEELLDLSMIESGQAPLRLAAHALKEVAQTQVDRLLTQARPKELDLRIDIPDEVLVLVDEAMIGRVISNLVHNAIKFTESGEIIVSVADPNGQAPAEADDEPGGEWVTVRVSDTGIGLPPDEINRIFERFYVVDRARDRKKAGTGLGLAIAKHIVEAHGGRIWATSDGHSGTTFWFTLPVDQKLPAQA
jgi:two-component system phosphate regulon sensor histidine kinase PhoR